jgi:hypothetical protein
VGDAVRRAVVVAALLLAAPASAHRAGDSFLRLSVEGSDVAGRLEIALRDLEAAVGIDTDADGALGAAEVVAAGPRMAAYARGKLAMFAGDAACALAVEPDGAARRDGLTYAVLRVSARCPEAPSSLTVEDRIMFEVDRAHRGLISLRAGRQAQTGVARPDEPRVTFAVAAPSVVAELVGFAGEGVLHIWGGLDHVLFLLVLLLPAVLVRRNGRWVPAAGLGGIATDVLKVVTAFTVAHSLTLALSVLEVVRLPSRLVEAGIAVTVLAAALNNLVPLSRARWPMAFYLGLLHGFGFSNVLGDLGVAGAGAAPALLGFNLGRRAGPGGHRRRLPARRLRGPLHLALPPPDPGAGSLAVATTAVVWTIERLA